MEGTEDFGKNSDIPMGKEAQKKLVVFTYFKAGVETSNRLYSFSARYECYRREQLSNSEFSQRYGPRFWIVRFTRHFIKAALRCHSFDDPLGKRRDCSKAGLLTEERSCLLVEVG